MTYVNIKLVNAHEEIDMASVQAFLYDAFTEARFGGNTAGVVLHSGIDHASMAQIAAELNAPTTGFVQALADNTWSIRFFTPSTEIDMCGHVLIGVFSALSDLGVIPAGNYSVKAVTPAGDLPVAVSRPVEGRPLIEMTQRRPTFRSVTVQKYDICQFLGIRLDDMHPHLPIELVSTGLTHLIIPVRDVSVLSKLRPQFGTLGELSQRLGADTVPVIAMDGLADDVTVRVRDFCPGIGNNEEAASGTTNGATACYLVQHKQLVSGQPTIVVNAEQGVEMGRKSVIVSRLTLSNAGDVQEVTVAGHAVPVMSGTFLMG